MNKKVTEMIIKIGIAIIICINVVSAYSQHLNSIAQKKFISKFTNIYHVNNNYLNKLFSHAKFNPATIEHIKKPYEKKPWYIYKKHFLTNNRVRAGVIFWMHNADMLHRAKITYGVPESIITAILGVETYYGENQGDYKVLDSLATLAFNYPPRAKFFSYELTKYLLLTQYLKLDPLKITGSYAGAVGYPQFMPDIYLNYVLKDSNNNMADLFHNEADAIDAIACFLAKNGWQAREPITIPAKVVGKRYVKLLNNDLTAQYSLTTLNKYGIAPIRKIKNNYLANLNVLQGTQGPEYWLGFHNFYVITHYNPNQQYAMAVCQLAKKIKAIYKESL